MNDARPTPIFVIGMNRTGTKWLSNLIANHSQVAAVQHQDHTGVLETNAFHAWRAKFRDLSLADEYVGLVELWCRTDFLRIAGTDPRLLYELDPRPSDPAGMLGAIMDDLARRRGRPFWLQKASPWSAREIRERFPHARCVVIERDRRDTLRSTHYLVTGGERSLPLRTIVSHRLQELLLAEARGLGALSTRFDALRSAPREELTRICKGLGLDFEPPMLDLPWRRNTSFADREARSYAFSPSEERKIRLTSALVAALPGAALELAHRLFRTRELPAVEGTFRQTGRERGLASYASNPGDAP